jgi:hypothetical protein
MKAFYYLVAALLALYVVMQMIFDIWIYRATKNLDLVLDVWFNRHKTYLANSLQIKTYFASGCDGSSVWQLRRQYSSFS